jgi:transketolase
MFNTIDDLSVTSIRTLAIDAIEKANSGHPGMPMGAAPMTYTLWTRFMNQNPKNPHCLTVIVLSYQQDMDQRYYTACFTCLVSI